MIDMHMHSIYSDGSETIETILKMCEDKKLKYISITDHDTCKQYNDEAIKENSFFSGKIIKGAELRTVFQDRRMEILAYGINTTILEKWLEKYYTAEKIEEKQKQAYRELLRIFDKQGIVYNEANMRKAKPTEFVEKIIYKEAITHPENHKLIEEFTQSYAGFFRKGITNPKSPYFMKAYEIPEYKEVIDIIHKAGGKAFLAHPFEYKWEDTFEFIDVLIKMAHLDGIECYHPSAEEDNKINLLLEYCKKNKLYITGGSDFHGTNKPGVELGQGKGSLNIPEEIIKEWI